MRNDIVKIKNASFYAYHGVEKDEQHYGGKFEVDAEIQGDLSAALTSDNLNSTINYERVYAIMEQVITGKKYFLIEALAGAIAKKILREFPMADRATVRVRKPHPRVKGVVDYAEAEITEQR